MEYAFQAKGARVHSDGRMVIIEQDNGTRITFPAIKIAKIIFHPVQKDQDGSVIIRLHEDQQGAPTEYELHVDNAQFAQAQAFEQALRAPSSPHAAKKKSTKAKVAVWVPIVSAIAGLVIGFGGTWIYDSFVIAQMDAQISQQEQEIDELQSVLDPDRNQQDDTRDGSQQKESSDKQAGHPNEEVVSGGITLKLTDFGEKPTISYKKYNDCNNDCNAMGYGPKAPDKDTKFWTATVEVTNNTKRPLDITCGYPYSIVALSSKGERYTPIDDLSEVEGNPACNAQLQPGMKTTATYPFQVPIKTKIIGIAFRDAGDLLHGDNGPEEYSTILTDKNYSSKQLDQMVN